MAGGRCGGGWGKEGHVGHTKASELYPMHNGETRVDFSKQASIPFHAPFVRND